MTSGPARRIYGVDFSGARDAGRKIWIAGGDVEDDELVVEDCQSAADRFGTTDRTAVFGELRDFVRERPDCLFGFDFPFGIPRAVVDGEEWRSVLDWFADRFTDPTHLRETCTEDGDGYRPRATDALAGAMCPYNSRVQYQTFYGIGEVLHPLVADGVPVSPMTNPGAEPRGLIEVYPAATLDRYGLHRDGYKEATERATTRRTRNLNGLVERADLRIADPLRGTVAADDEGDALDSIVAACATFRAAREGPLSMGDLSAPEGFDGTDEAYRGAVGVEGRIYV
jgi:hypothetical protein